MRFKDKVAATVERAGPLLVESSTHRCWHPSSHPHTEPSSAWSEWCSKEWGCCVLLLYSTKASPTCPRSHQYGSHQGDQEHLD